MKIDQKLLDELTAKAKVNPRHRMHYDLRTQAEETAVNGSRLMVNDEEWKDTSQRMLNVMMKDTVIPIHRHSETSETVIVLRGSGDEVTYDETGKEIERVTLRYGTECAAVQVPRNVYHTFIPHADGTVIFEAKDRAYDPVGTEEMLKANMEGGEGASPRDDKTALENIFLTIIAELPKQNCSTQNLKDYLNDSENNAVVIPLFSEAFDEYKKGNKVNIAKRVCELVKTYVSKDEKEVRL